MSIPTEVKFLNADRSEALEARIRERVERLERFHDGLLACEVVVSAPHQHKHKGHVYRVAVRLELPGGELLANRGSEKDHAHEDPYVAVRDAFDAMKRQLEDHVRRHDHRTRPNEPGS